MIFRVKNHRNQVWYERAKVRVVGGRASVISVKEEFERRYSNYKNVKAEVLRENGICFSPGSSIGAEDRFFVLMDVWPDVFTRGIGGRSYRAPRRATWL